jgi:hypothetical protein
VSVRGLTAGIVTVGASAVVGIDGSADVEFGGASAVVGIDGSVDVELGGLSRIELSGTIVIFLRGILSVSEGDEGTSELAPK